MNKVDNRVESAVREAELALYNAPFEEDGWPGAIDRVRAAVGACTANLVGLGGATPLPLCFWVGYNSDQADLVARDPDLWGECNWRVGTTRAPLDIQHDQHYAVYRARTDTERYDDVMSDLDMMGGCQSAVMIGNEAFVGLALAWGKRRPGFDAGAFDRFARLRTVLHRAVRMQMALDGEAASLMLGDDVEGMHFLFDRHGRMCAMTPAAEKLLDTGGPFRLLGSSLVAVNAAERRGMEQACARLLSTDGPVVHEVRVGRSAARPNGRYRSSLVRLPHRPHGLGFAPALSMTVSALRVP